MISSENSQPDFINPDCTCRISKGLQTSVLLMQFLPITSSSQKHQTESSLRKKIKWGKIQLFSFRFSKILALMRIQGKEIGSKKK